MDFKAVDFKGVKFSVSEDGEIITNLRTGNQLKLRTDPDGYRVCNTHCHGKKVNIRVHQLVAKAFLGDCPPGCVIDHIDRNRANNHFSNLRYVSLSEQNKNRDYTNINKLNKAKAQLSRKVRSRPVSLVSADECIDFNSVTEVIFWVMEKRECSFDAAKIYVYRHIERRQKVLGYEVFYND